MDITKLIQSFNREDISEKEMSDIIAVFRENHKAYLSHIDEVVSPRKKALSLSLISRKKGVADYIKKNDDILAVIEELLSDNDPKVRKNIYSLYANIGLHIDRFYAMLNAEDSYINVVHLLTIIGKMDNVNLAILKRKVDAMDKHDKNYKKAQDIMANLRLKKRERLMLSHPSSSDLYLLTATSTAKNVLGDDIVSHGMKIAQSIQEGILVTSKYSLDEIWKVRTFDELLIAPNRSYRVNADVDAIAKHVCELLNVEYFQSIFGSMADKYSYRLEIRGVDAKARVAMSKAVLDAVKDAHFTNIRDSYDFEIRVYVFGKFANIFVKVPYDDPRFAYRKGALPASISPVTASVITALIKPYIGIPHCVLDGFVGTGTMLVEFYKRFGDAHYVGVDIENNAIELAKGNTAGVIPDIELVRSDIVAYSSDIKADVIISNMPFGTRVLKHDSILTLYDKFAHHLNDILASNGRAFLLTTNGKAIRDSLSRNGYKVIKEFRVESGGLIPYLFVVERR